MKAKFAISVVAALAVLATIPFLLWAYEAHHLFWPRERFDAAAWKTGPYQQRYRQVNDLLSKHQLTGLSKAEIEALLGQPESYAPDGMYLTYLLKDGDQDRFTFNAIYFLRVFMKDGRVTKVAVEAD